ncbi:cytochrome b5-like heme/steroid binding domain-containing protein, partial [Powellomyces hirtus]
STAADRDAKLNAFPALNGPQRAGVLGSARRKVPLEPGHSPLDWARLLTSGKNLRGVPQLARYTLADVAAHRKRDDCWMSIQGKVYNVTHYMKFHPGGAGQLMRGAGKDATELFMKVHPWVNVDTLLDKCQVGYLV